MAISVECARVYRMRSELEFFVYIIYYVYICLKIKKIKILTINDVKYISSPALTLLGQDVIKNRFRFVNLYYLLFTIKAIRLRFVYLLSFVWKAYRWFILRRTLEVAFIYNYDVFTF